MKTPRRLLDEPSLTGVERRSLLAAQNVEPSRELVGAMWAELAATAGATGAAAGALSGGAHGGSGSGFVHAIVSGKLTVLKALVVGAAVGAVTTGGAVVVSRAVTPSHGGAPAVSVEAPHSAATAVSAPVAPHVTETPAVSAEPAKAAKAPSLPSAPAAVPEKSPAVAAFAAPSAAPSAGAPAVAGAQSDDSRDEARLVGVAREASRRRDPSSALLALEETARRYPDGILLQEREALFISALAAVGRTGEASARARAFLRAFPNSPHAARVRAALR